MNSPSINLELPESDRDGLGLLAAQQGVPVADLVRQSIKHLDNETIAKVVVSALEQPEVKAKAKAIHTSMYLDPSDVTLIDTMAKKLVSTRNALMKLIIKGILSGVVR